MGNTVPRGEGVVDSGVCCSCEDWNDYVLITGPPEQTDSARKEEGSDRSLEESIDSGYEEPNQCTHGDRQKHGETEEPCRTIRCLGEHHSYYDYRYYQYSEEDCEGNRHITDEDL